ncbi:MAG: hypothetical protein RIQ52_122 [Pseudomonadota bacterium]
MSYSDARPVSRAPLSILSGRGRLRWLAFTLLGAATSGVSAETYYNVTDYLTDSTTRVASPLVWVPSQSLLNYAGSLDAHWLARLGSANETLVLSNADAIARTGKADFGVLTVMPDNCWGMNMGFGLIHLAQNANLTIKVEADRSSVIPGFAFYKGWDTSKSASRHGTIYFVDNNNAAGKVTSPPLGSSGLTLLGDQLGSQAGGVVTKTFENLSAGNYELFVTVGNNYSQAGEYKVTLTTSSTLLQPPSAPLSVSATASDGKAYVSWNAPASNGGSTISAYTATSVPGGKTCTAAATSCSVTGLTNGTSYTFTVKAANSAGESLASQPSAAVTPMAVVTGSTPVFALSAKPSVVSRKSASLVFSAGNNAWGNPENGVLGQSRTSGWGIVKLTKGVPVKLTVVSEYADIHPGISVWKRPGPGEYRYGPVEKVKINNAWVTRGSLLIGNLLDARYVPAASYEQVRSNHISGATDCGAGCGLAVNGSPVSSGNIRLQYIVGGFDRDGASYPQAINADPALTAIKDAVPGKVEVKFTPDETAVYQFAVGGIFPSGAEASVPGSLRKFTVNVVGTGIVDMP